MKKIHTVQKSMQEKLGRSNSLDFWGLIPKATSVSFPLFQKFFPALRNLLQVCSSPSTPLPHQRAHTLFCILLFSLNDISLSSMCICTYAVIFDFKIHILSQFNPRWLHEVRGSWWAWASSGNRNHTKKHEGSTLQKCVRLNQETPTK